MSKEEMKWALKECMLRLTSESGFGKLPDSELSKNYIVAALEALYLNGARDALNKALHE